jgi:hypothetical protein
MFTLAGKNRLTARRTRSLKPTIEAPSRPTRRDRQAADRQQLVTNQRPVLDQLVFIKLHHARTLLAPP